MTNHERPDTWKKDLASLLEHLQRCEAAGMPGFPFMHYFPDWLLEELSAAGYTFQLRRACGHYVFLPRNPQHEEVQDMPKSQLLTEKVELDGRIAALRAEMSLPSFTLLPDDEQDRVASQLAWMTGYSKVLGERLAAFTTKA